MAFTDYETEQLRKALLKETRHCAVTPGMKKTSVEQLTVHGLKLTACSRSGNCIRRCWKRWCTALAGSYLNKRKAAEMRLFQDTTVSTT